MISKTSYRKKSRIWDAKIREIVKYFSLDFTSDKTAILTRLNPKTTQDWYRYIRKAIAFLCEREKNEIWTGNIEIDESYFWPTRVRWKRGRWAGMKTIVFGLLKRNGKVYTEIVPDVKAKTLVPIIRWKLSMEESEINSDGWRAYWIWETLPCSSWSKWVCQMNSTHQWNRVILEFHKKKTFSIQWNQENLFLLFFERIWI